MPTLQNTPQRSSQQESQRQQWRTAESISLCQTHLSVVLQFAALVLTPTVQEATDEALVEEEDDNIDRIASAIPVDLIFVGCFVKVDN